MSGYVGFRFTQPNLHFVSSIVQCETQQWPILEPSPLGDCSVTLTSRAGYPDLAKTDLSVNKNMMLLSQNEFASGTKKTGRQ
jgi:hypothetical protein